MSKKGENIYKRKDGRWEARYIKRHTVDGVIRYGYCYGASYREAKEKVEQAKAALLTNTPSPDDGKRRRFSSYCDEWLRLSRNRVKESTYMKYLTTIENHIKPKLGSYPVTALSSVLVEEFSNELLSEEGLSPKTVRDILAMVHSILKHTAKQRPDLLQRVDVVYPKEEKQQPRVLTIEEQTRFIGYLLTDTDSCKFGVLLALLTGLRIGEICALRWKNIELEEGVLSVNAAMQRLRDISDTRQRTKVVISQPKSAMSVRRIPLTDYALALCKRWRIENQNAFVLTGEEDHYLEPRTLQYRLKRYTDACGLKDVHFHMLRHTFATRCVEVGVEIKSLSEILGHTSPRFTLERYVHSSMAFKRNEINKLNSIL